MSPRYLAALAAGLVACGGSAPSIAPPPAAPPPPVTTSAPPAQAFAAIETELVFADPDRRKKLAAAFPAIDAIVDAALRDKKLPAIELAVVVDGELAHVKGAGVVDLQTKAPPDADTLFRIGSLTKAFTAMAVLSLRDEGVLSLDDPITRFVPEAAGLVYPTRDTPPITLRQLLTHTSGLPWMPRVDAHGLDHEITEAELLQSLAGFSLAQPPGTGYAYSNVGYALLGIAAGRASRSSYRALVKQRIFEPLGMTSSGWDPAGLPPGRLATPHARGHAGAPVPTRTPRLGPHEAEGGLYTSARDLARWMAFNLSAHPPRNAPDDGPIRRSTVREAHAPATRSAPLAVRTRPAPAPGEDLVTAISGTYGFGWANDETCEFDRIVGHGGAINGYSANLALLPEHGVGVVALANYLSPGENLDGLVKDVLRALKKTGGLAKRVPRAKQVSPALTVAMERLLAVQNTWSREGYEAMLSKRRGPSPEEQEELAGYRATHGACKAFTPATVSSPVKATFALQCERGALEMLVELNPADDRILGFVGTSRGLTPPPKLAATADRLAGLVGRWDDGVYRKHLATKAKSARAETAASFDRLRAVHGACTVKSFHRWSNRPEFLLGCERGGGVTLTLSLDEKDEDVVTSYAITEEGGGPCPVK